MNNKLLMNLLMVFLFFINLLMKNKKTNLLLISIYNNGILVSQAEWNRIMEFLKLISKRKKLKCNKKTLNNFLCILKSIFNKFKIMNKIKNTYRQFKDLNQ